MRLKLCAMTTAALAFAFARARFAEQVKSDWDRSANFGQFRTYSWERVSTRDPLMVDRIKSAVSAVLASKGWTEVPSGAAAAVVAIETTHDQQTLDTFYDGFGGGWGWRGFGGIGDATTTVETYKVGTLVVDIFDANKKKLIWRGSASDALSNNSSTNIKNIGKSVNKMLGYFPPSGKKSASPTSYRADIGIRMA
jgi:hypothetical protein